MKIDHRGQQTELPDFLIVGAAKSGTTTLYHLLNQHPDVFIPRQKEPFYFCFENKKPKYTDKDFVRNICWEESKYFDLFKNVPENRLIGDGSTAYLYLFNESIRHIQTTYGAASKNLKIIIILRNPVDRAFSHYNFLVRDQFEDLSFEEAIQAENIEQRITRRWGFDYLEYGMYSKQVKAYLDLFPETKVIFFEDLSKPQEMMKNLASFLGLKNWNFDTNIASNPSGVAKNQRIVKLLLKNDILRGFVHLLPKKMRLRLMKQRDQLLEKMLVKNKMNGSTRNSLIEFFNDDIERLEGMLNVDLSHWKNSKSVDE